MFKGFNNRQQHSFPNINFGGNYGQAYNFSRCLLWLDAAYGTSTVVNGANVSSWQDKINGVIYTNDTVAEQPTYVLSDVNFNNLPTINFGINANRMLESNLSIPLGINTLAIIIKSNGIATDYTSILSSNAQRTGFMSGGGGSNATGYGFYTNGSNPMTRSNVEDTNMHIIIANRSFIIIDGVDQLVTPSSFSNVFSFIGSNGANFRPNCNIAEILIYDSFLGSSDCIQLSNNINAKYLKY
jgi:hypothetical protein